MLWVILFSSEPVLLEAWYGPDTGSLYRLEGCIARYPGMREAEASNWLILANRLNDLDRTLGYLSWFYRVID